MIQRFFHQKPKGWTIIELMITIGMMGIIFPALTTLFTVCFQGLSSVEMHLQTKSLNEQIALHLHEQINASKHMYQNNGYASTIMNQLSITASGAPAPATFAGSIATYQLADAQSNTTNTFSPYSAVVTDFGNCLFYAATDRPLTISGVKYTAPLTISGASVTNSSGAPATVNLDVYRFYFDYLSSAGDLKTIPNITNYWLIEWQSVQFVDAFELNDLANADTSGKLEQNVINYLTTAGNFANGKALTLAYDPSQAGMAMTNASGSVTGYSFYNLTNGTTMAPTTTLTIPMQSWTPLTRTSSGAIAGFNYGIPGNYPALGGNPPVPTIPKYASATTVANAFPGGFEVGIKGSAGGMQVLIRSVLIAKGNGKNYIWDDNTSLSNARDIW